MPRIVKLFDKDSNYIQELTQIDGEQSPSVSEKGFGPLQLVYRGDYSDIDHADIIKIQDGYTEDTTYENTEYYAFSSAGSENVQSNATHSGNLTSGSYVCFSVWFRLGADGTASTNSQPIVELPYVRAYVTDTDNKIQLRYDNAGAKVSFYSMGNGDRDWHHLVCAVYNNGTNWQRDLYLDNVLVDSDTHASGPSTKYTDYVTMGKYTLGPSYFTGDLHEFRVFKFTGTSFSATDVDRLYKGLDPTVTTGIVEYLRRGTDEGTGTTADDETANNRDGTITGAAHEEDEEAPFANYYKTLVDNFIYAGFVITKTPVKEARKSYTLIECLGLQALLSKQIYSYPYEYPRNNSDITTDADPGQIVRECIERAPTNLDYERDNLFTYTTELDNAAWVITGGTSAVTANDDTAPDGTLTADLVDLTATGAPNTLLQTVPTINVDNKAYVVRARVKADTGTRTFRFTIVNVGIAAVYSDDLEVDTTRRLLSRQTTLGSGGTGGIKAGIATPTAGGAKVYLWGVELFEAATCGIQRYGSNIEIPLDNVDCLSLIDQVVQYTGRQLGRDATGIVSFFEKDTTGTPDRYIDEQRYCTTIEMKEDTSSIENYIRVKYNGSFEVSASDATSITDYGERAKWIDKSDVLDTATATLYRDTYLSTHKDPIKNIKVVTSGYPDAKYLKVGDLVKLNGDSLSLGANYITKIDYRTYETTLYLNSYESMEKSLLRLG